MPVPASPAPWAGSLLWLAILAIVSFAISWAAADRFQLKRTPYIGVLMVITTALSVGYIAWVGVDAWEVVSTRWVWGLAAAPLSAAFLVVGMTRLPVVHRLTGGRLALAMLWEGVVYGTAEGLLLSVLPVFMTWQIVYSLSWSGAAGVLARWTLPMVASVAVIVVHHLGYWEYRNRLLVPIAVGCGLLSLGYLVTASPIAAVLGHILGHGSSLRHGAELPPHPHRGSVRRPTPSALTVQG